MRRPAFTLVPGALVAVSTLLALAAPLSAQRAAPPAGWTYGIGGIVILWSDAGFSSGGPALQLSRVTPRGIGFDFRAAYLMPSGPDDVQGGSAILGLSYGVPLGAHLFQVKAGVTGVGLANSGGAGGDVGPYLGGGILFRLTGRIGLHLDALARFYGGGVDGPGTTPSLGLAVVALP